MPPLLEPFRHRRFTLVWGGQLVSILGDAALVVAMPLYLRPAADPARTLGLVLGAWAVGGVVSLLVGGALADRHRRTRIIAASDLVRLAGLLGALALGPRAAPTALGACALVMGIGIGLYRPAFGAVLPTLVPAAAVRAANSLRSFTTRGAAVLGAGLGGLLLAAAGPRWVLWADAGSFAVSALSVLAVTEPRPDRTGTASFAADLAAGLRYVRQRPWLTAVMLQGTVQLALVAAPMTLLVPLLLGARSGQYSVLVMAESAGALVGALLGRALSRGRPGVLALGCLLGQLPQVLALALHLPVAVLIGASALAGAAMSVFGVVWVSALQAGVPRSHLGRVLSIDALAASGLQPVGLLLAARLAGALGTDGLAWAAAAVLVLSVLAVLPVPGVLDLADPAPATSEGAPSRA